MIHFDFPLKAHHTFHTDAIAACFAEYSSVEELQSILQNTTLPRPFFSIGEGSNLLFLEDYFKGTLLHSKLKGITLVEESGDALCVKVGSGVQWDDFVAECVEQGWCGVENLSYIPGNVGAAAVQNIGAYGVEAKDLIVAVEAIELSSGRQQMFDVASCNYGYRDSVFKRELKGQYVVVSVQFSLSRTFSPVLSYGNLLRQFADSSTCSLKEIRDYIIQTRKAKLPEPEEFGNAGSFFMNPVVSFEFFQKLQRKYPDIPYYVVEKDQRKIPAAWLIDQCGWKGRSKGNAAVYEYQPLVIINKGNATAKEIKELSDAVIASVKSRFAIELKPEVLFL